MEYYWHAIYIPALSRLIEQPYHYPHSLILLGLAILAGAAVTHAVVMADCSLTKSYGSTLWIFGLAILISPQILRMVDHYAQPIDPAMQEAMRYLLALLIPGILVGAALICNRYRVTFLSAVLSILPGLCTWFLCIILLNQIMGAVHIGGYKMESIRSRTFELDRLLDR